MAAPLPSQIKDFIAQYIDSVEELEVLALLGENAAKAWAPAEILKIVQSSEGSVGRCLEALEKAGLIASPKPSQYQFVARDADIARLLSDLLMAYRERRVSVIECVYSKPGVTVRDFADAFRLRKDK